MKAKLNCWEHKHCGRENGGANTRTRGICPASTVRALDGVHGGHNSGRACWVVVGTLCKGEVQGSFAAKLASCQDCDFYLQVKAEEGSEFVLSPLLLRKLTDAADAA